MNLLIEQTRVTPLVEYVDEEHVLRLTGRSSPENPVMFYQRISDFIEEFRASESSSLTVNVSMEYFNTSSTKCIFNLFKRMDEIQEGADKVIVINWYYEDWDDDMLEMGEDFECFLDLEFNLKEVEDINSLTLEAA